MKKNIIFQKDKFKFNKEFVWYDKFCIGYLEHNIKEKKNIDWQKYRADKSLKLEIKERYAVKYTAYAFPNIFCGSFLDKKEAAENIKNAHKENFDI